MDVYGFSLLYQSVLYILTFNSSQRGLKADVCPLIPDLPFYNQDENLIPITQVFAVVIVAVFFLFKAKLYTFININTILFCSCWD